MNIIREQRESIIRDNNTAQTELLRILERKDKRSNELLISEQLHGDLDFSVLADEGFSHVKKIILEPGEVTSIQNLPDTLVSLQCSQQLLTGLENLPPSLEELDAEHNYLVRIDFSKNKNLHILKLSHNHIVEIEHLPESLIELHCENNQIKRLDLVDTIHLKVLHVSNNKTIIIENVPPSLVDFKSENNPLIEIEYANQRSARKTEEQQEKRVNYIEGIYEYFKLKSKYEDAYKKVQKKVYRDAIERGNSKKIAKKLLYEVKPKCINCKRPVGTIFETKNHKYNAICGDKTNPCKLNISIFNQTSSHNEAMLYTFKKMVEDAKEAIIVQKMDMLFEFVPEDMVVAGFKRELKEYNDTSSIYKELFDLQNELHYDVHHNELIKQKQSDIYDIISTVREMMNEYTSTGRSEILKTAVKIQVNELIPEIRNLRMLKYEIMEIDENDDTRMSVLVQKDVSLAKLDYSYGEPSEVLKFSKNV